MEIEFLAKAVFILGFLNVFFLLLIFLSCRCIVPKLFRGLWKYQWFQKFFRWHCWFWWLLFVSIILHVVFAFFVYGNPF